MGPMGKGGHTVVARSAGEYFGGAVVFGNSKIIPALSSGGVMKESTIWEVLRWHDRNFLS